MDSQIPLASDGLPTIDGCRPAVLRVLADGQVKHKRQIIKDVAEELNIPKELQDQTIPSGQNKLGNRVGWALSSLFNAGALERPQRAHYAITSAGRSLMTSKFHFSMSEDDLLVLPLWRSYQKELRERRERKPNTENTQAVDNVSTQIEPEELISSSIKKIEDQVATDLLKRLRESEPDFFEIAVLEVISHIVQVKDQESIRHLGRSGDGGIDGVVKLDPLGLRNIYVQAKRYSADNKVGSDALRNFWGAIAEKHADNGVFITSSSYTKAAKDYAHNMGEKIVLIDGQRLVDLMLTYKVGVQVKETYEVLEVDEDFFE